MSIIQNGVERWPAFQDQAPLQIFSDVLVIVSGSLLWRTELANRAESLKMIWEKARFREESLNRAEAGLGDTLWTSRMRKRASNTNNNAGGNGARRRKSDERIDARTFEYIIYWYDTTRESAWNVARRRDDRVEQPASGRRAARSDAT